MEEPAQVQCPWCGETIDVFVDTSQLEQSYTEDCQVCCRPISMRFSMDSSGGIYGSTGRD